MRGCAVTKLFVPDQRLFRLKLTGNDRETARDCLTLAHLPDYDRSLEEHAGSQREAYQSRWERVTNRLDYLTHLGPAATVPEDGLWGRRLCITSLAGVGKSICLQQLAVVRQQRVRGQVVLRLHFATLPLRADEIWAILLNMVRDRIQAKCPQNRPSGDVIWKWLHDLAGSGRLTLVIDALDEDRVALCEKGNVYEIGIGKIRALRIFLQWHPHVHCVVAGRPYAITQYYWHALFARTPDELTCDASDWEFCITEVFTFAQAQLYMGESRVNQLFRLSPDCRLNPRTLDVLRLLRPEQIRSLRSIADVYWHGLHKSIGWDNRSTSDKPRPTNLDLDEIINLLGALAVTAAQRESPLLQPRAVDITGPLSERIRRVLTLDPLGSEDPVTRKQKLEDIYRIGNQFVELRYFSFDESSKELRWTSTTARDFFAAMWLVRHGTESELNWLISRPSRVLSSHLDTSQHSAQLDLWRFVCGMPDDALMVGETDVGAGRWLEMIRTLFQRPMEVPRPTELMLLSWPSLLRRAGYLKTAAWEEPDLQRATKEAQMAADAKSIMPAVSQLMETEFSHRSVSSASARQILWEFLSEYPRQRDGASKVLCTEDLESQWKPCDSAPGKEFWAGEGSAIGSGAPVQRTLKTAFMLCAIPITRRLYALFDPLHEREFAGHLQFSADPRCAAPYLSYWDAAMVSIWLHARLPDEWEWEYACRGGIDGPGDQQPIWWRDDEDELDEYARLASNSGFPTHPVGAKLANPFGLYDVLGNVWEWTSSMSFARDTSRVARGGGFSDELILPCCSSRRVMDPSASDMETGCRVLKDLS
jgi:hypothetical protein